MKLDELKDRTQKHGLHLFKAQPVVTEYFLIVDTENKKFFPPMTIAQLEEFLDAKDKQADLEREPF